MKARLTRAARTAPSSIVEVLNDRFGTDLTATVRVSGYAAIDPGFSSSLSQRYWASAGPDVSVPDSTAPGFGSDNAAGFPKNQYVRPYVRSDGTMVTGYWRNDPTDGLPTCEVISCH
jgi:hypothetical protein